jgi:F-type H+-transporting ATPase subunit b
MSVLGIIAVNLGGHLSHIGRIAGETITTDPDGHVTTNNPILPETAEIIYGGIAFLLIFGALWKFGGPMVKKAMAARTEKIQKELDAAAADQASAANEAAQIRQAKGDIEAERARLLADANAQAAAVMEDGRARLAQEVAELEAKGIADIASAQGRVGDELRAEVARLSAAAVDHVVTGSLDDATHQELIENFINRVGAPA